MKLKASILATVIMAAVGFGGVTTAACAANPWQGVVDAQNRLDQQKAERLAKEEARRQAELAAQRAHEQKMAKIAAAQRAKQAAAQAAARQAKENERLADKARDQGYEDELRALALEEKRMELAHKKAMLEAQSRAADKYIEQDLNAHKAATDVIQSHADANRNVSEGIRDNLQKNGDAQIKQAGKLW